MEMLDLCHWGKHGHFHKNPNLGVISWFTLYIDLDSHMTLTRYSTNTNLYGRDNYETTFTVNSETSAMLECTQKYHKTCKTSNRVFSQSIRPFLY